MLRAAFRLCVAAHVGSAAEGSADVRGPHLHEVFELEQFAQGPEEVPSTLLGLHDQVGAGEVPDEQRVPGEQQPGLSPVEVGKPAKELTLLPAEVPDMDRLMSVAAKYDIDILGPLPEG
jgi:hypothetical protein